MRAARAIAVVALGGVLVPSLVLGQLTDKQRAELRSVYEEALAVPVTQFETLSQLDFSTDYGERPAPWRIGPFALDPSMTFSKTRAWDDPTGIGWTSTIIGNPTLIERDGRLHMFYRGYPRKESQSTRIGHAIYTPEGGWEDQSGPPVLHPTEPDELRSVEDPKIYRRGGEYFLFYNAVWRPDPEFSARVRRGYRDWGVFVVTKLATSRDLVRFEKRGPVVPYEVSRGWSKGAVIPRSPDGEAVKIGGQYLMFLSEGCGDQQYIGRSEDLVHWEFRPQTYLELPPGWGRIAEVACCAARFEPTGDFFLLDFFYKDEQQVYRAAQALYRIDDPTRPLSIQKGGSLAWGGLLQYRGDWIVGQGWDSPKGRQDLYVYRFRGNPRVVDRQISRGLRPERRGRAAWRR
jgi:predicted GH43/DUF377 family glycosyl hydrolase